MVISFAGAIDAIMARADAVSVSGVVAVFYPLVFDCGLESVDTLVECGEVGDASDDCADAGAVSSACCWRRGVVLGD